MDQSQKHVKGVKPVIKKSHIMSFYLYEIFGLDKPTETKSRSVVVKAFAEGRK